MEGDDTKVLDLIEAAVCAGGYRVRSREFPHRRMALEGMANGFSRRVQALADEISDAARFADRAASRVQR